MSLIQFFNGNLEVYSKTQTTSTNNDVTFMSPVVIDNEGNAYCGITVAEVLEDGFFIVDKNMNAAFSSALEESNNTGGGTTIINNTVDTSELEERIDELEKNVSDLTTLLKTITSIKIE